MVQGRVHCDYVDCVGIKILTLTDQPSYRGAPGELTNPSLNFSALQGWGAMSPLITSSQIHVPQLSMLRIAKYLFESRLKSGEVIHQDGCSMLGFLTMS